MAGFFKTWSSHSTNSSPSKTPVTSISKLFGSSDSSNNNNNSSGSSNISNSSNRNSVNLSSPSSTKSPLSKQRANSANNSNQATDSPLNSPTTNHHGTFSVLSGNSNRNTPPGSRQLSRDNSNGTPTSSRPGSTIRYDSGENSAETSNSATPTASPRGSLVGGAFSPNFSLPKITASLSRGLTQEASNICNMLLKDRSMISDLSNKTLNLEDLSTLLYRFFQVNGEEDQLFRWAIDVELQSKKDDSGSIFRGETLATKFFYIRFFGELGVRYLKNTIAPLIIELLEYKVTGEGNTMEISSLEIEPERAPKDVSTDENLQWFLERIDEFVDRLLTTSESCALYIREGLAYLLHSIDKNFAHMNKTECLNLVISVIFLRFFCPALVTPSSFNNLLSDEQLVRVKSPFIQRRLIIASRLIQLLANHMPVDEGKPNAQVINSFIESRYAKVVQFAQQLLNSQAIEKLKQVAEESVLAKPYFSDDEKKKAEEGLRNFVQIYYLPKKSTSTLIEMQYKNQLESLLECYRNEQDWKSIKTAKDQKLVFYEKISSDGTTPVTKIVGRFKADIGTLYDIIKYFPNMAKFMDNYVTGFQLMERFDDNNADYYVQTKGSFPYGPRDWLFTSRNYSDDNICVSCYYSIHREDAPSTSKYVRGIMSGSGYILERDALSPGFVLFTAVCNWNTQVTPSQSKRMARQPSMEMWKAFKRMHEYIVGE